VFLVFNKLLDRNQSDLHRFEPISRETLLNEQFDLWLLLLSRDVSKRHRGGEQR